MALKLEWTPTSRKDVNDWVDWLHELNPKSARKAVIELYRRTEQLTGLPFLGRVGFLDGTRELSLPKWKKVIVYSVGATSIQIFSIRDTRQDFKQKG
jgi:toxin ParE1/3/4